MKRPDPRTPVNDGQLSETAARRFDESVQRMDAATQSRLNKSRQRALAELGAEVGKGSGTWRRQWWIPAAGVATAVVVAITMLSQKSLLQEIPASALSDFEVIMAGENLEMLEELEFYRWLDTEAETDKVPVPDGHVG
jgi:hypothetical protein